MTIFLSLLASAILLGLVVFQLLLIFGAPLGKYAWSGQHKILPRKLRISSASSIVLYFIFALFILDKAGAVNVISSESVVNTGMWALTGYFVIGVIMNAISRSKRERMVMTPVAAILAVLFFAVAVN